MTVDGQLPLSSPAVPDQAPPSPVTPQQRDPEASQERPTCPSCGVPLPDPRHLVTGANLRLSGNLGGYAPPVATPEEDDDQ